MFQMPCKCFKRVANVQNTFIIFETHLKCFQARCKCFKRVANIQNTFYYYNI